MREISPAIWRRLLLRSDQTIADLHYTLQIVMGWSDLHLNRFVIKCCKGNNLKAGWFEVIAGKSVTWDSEAKSFGFVHKYDEKPKRRLNEVLQSQGLQMNQDITFLSDGGDTVRDLQFYLSPWSEHVLDWFHITMQLTVMKNTAKGLPPDSYLDTISDDLDSVKWYL